FSPRRDTTKPNALLLNWTANDKNLGQNSETLEWAKEPGGKWHEIQKNIAITGKHSWQPPDELPVEVYLRIRVTDIAGNVATAVTPAPPIIDFNMPEGRQAGRCRRSTASITSHSGPVNARGRRPQDDDNFCPEIVVTRCPLSMKNH